MSLSNVGMGGQLTTSRGVIDLIAMQPFGKILLAGVAMGLTGYGLWQLLRPNAPHVATRIGWVISGLIYLLLASTAIQKSLLNQNPQDGGTRTWAGGLLNEPFGEFLLIGIGIALFGVGAYKIYSALKNKFLRELDLRRLRDRKRETLVRMGKFGHIARAIVFMTIGTSLFFAGLRHNSSEAKDTGSALRTLSDLPYGQFILLAVAFGLFAFGIFRMMCAKYASIPEGTLKRQAKKLRHAIP